MGMGAWVCRCMGLLAAIGMLPRKYRSEKCHGTEGHSELVVVQDPQEETRGHSKSERMGASMLVAPRRSPRTRYIRESAVKSVPQGSACGGVAG